MRRHVVIYLMCYSILSIAFNCNAVLHPVLTNPRIKSCQNGAPWNGGDGPCSHLVKYDWGPISMIDILPQGAPDPQLGTELAAMGLHCRYGNMLTGSPFSQCVFTFNIGHAPNLKNCRLKNTNSWEITTDSTCHLETLISGAYHGGAGPGGECVLFVQRKASEGGLVNSIYGILDANTVANSGNRFCQKPLPPSVSCDISLPDMIDHGVIGPNSSSSVTLDGTIRCGSNPVVSFVPASGIDLAPGVTTRMSSKLTGGDRIQITSDLKTNNGAPGAHSASVVVLVSPY